MGTGCQVNPFPSRVICEIVLSQGRSIPGNDEAPFRQKTLAFASDFV